MEDNRLEHKFKTSFEAHRPELDHDQLWNDIEPHLNKKKNRPFPFWLFGMGVIVLLGASFLMTSVSSPKEHVAQQAASLTAISNLIETTENKNITNTPQANSQTKNTSTQKLTTTNSSKAIQPISNEESTAQLVQKNKTIQKTVVLKTATFSLADGSTTPPFWGGRFVKSTPSASELSYNKITSSAPTELAIENAITLTPKNQLNAVNQLPNKWSKLSITSPLVLAMAEPPIIKVKKKLPTLINFYASPDYTFNVWRDKEKDSELTEIRQQSEKPLESFSAGLNIQQQYRNGFIWSIGMDYRQINTKLEVRQKTVEEIILKDGVISVIEDPFGKPSIHQVGEKPATQITVQEKDVYNNYISLHLPIGVGYHFKTRRAHMQLMSGIDINVFNLSYGELLDENGQINRLNSLVDGRPQFYKRNTGLSFWLSASYAQPISQHWSVFASPYFSLQLGSTTVADYGLIHKQHGVGARIGVRYHVPSKK